MKKEFDNTTKSVYESNSLNEDNKNTDYYELLMALPKETLANMIINMQENFKIYYIPTYPYSPINPYPFWPYPWQQVWYASNVTNKLQ